MISILVLLLFALGSSYAISADPGTCSDTLLATDESEDIWSDVLDILRDLDTEVMNKGTEIQPDASIPVIPEEDDSVSPNFSVLASNHNNNYVNPTENYKCTDEEVSVMSNSSDDENLDNDVSIANLGENVADNDLSLVA